MPVRSCHQELTHTMWLVRWWLLYQSASVDEFFIECINVFDMQVSEVAMVTCRKWRDGIWTMTDHDAHVPARKELPACPFGPFSLEAKGISEVGSIPLEVRYGQHERKRT